MMDGVEDHVLALTRAPGAEMAGEVIISAADDDVIHIASSPGKQLAG